MQKDISAHLSDHEIDLEVASDDDEATANAFLDDCVPYADVFIEGITRNVFHRIFGEGNVESEVVLSGITEEDDDDETQTEHGSDDNNTSPSLEDDEHEIGHISPETQKEMAEYVLKWIESIFEIVYSIYTTNEDRFLTIVGLSPERIRQLFLGQIFIPDILATTQLTDEKVTQVKALIIDLFENYIYSVNLEERLFQFAITLTRQCLPEDDIFQSAQIDDWINSHPVELYDIEMQSFRTTVNQIFDDHRAAIDRWVQMKIRSVLRLCTELSSGLLITH